MLIKVSKYVLEWFVSAKTSENDEVCENEGVISSEGVNCKADQATDGAINVPWMARLTDGFEFSQNCSKSISVKREDERDE